MPTNTTTSNQLSDSSQSAYDPNDGKPDSLGPEWIIVDAPNQQLKDNWASKGFYAEAYVNTSTGELIIANRGSKELKNFYVTDALLASVGVNNLKSMAEDAAEYFLTQAEKQLKPTGLSVEDVYFTGHSLGGALAQLETKWFASEFEDLNLYSVTFDSPGIGWHALGTNASDYKSVNFSSQGDIVNYGGFASLNGTVDVKLPFGPLANETVGGIVAGITLGSFVFTAYGAYTALAVAHTSAFGQQISGTELGDTPFAELAASSSFTRAGLLASWKVKSTPFVADSAGFDVATGYNLAGYNIFGLNKDGAIDPNYQVGTFTRSSGNSAIGFSEATVVTHSSNGDITVEVTESMYGVQTGHSVTTYSVSGNTRLPKTQTITVYETVNGEPVRNVASSTFATDGSFVTTAASYNANNQLLKQVQVTGNAAPTTQGVKSFEIASYYIPGQSAATGTVTLSYDAEHKMIGGVVSGIVSDETFNQGAELTLLPGASITVQMQGGTKTYVNASAGSSKTVHVPSKTELQMAGDIGSSIGSSLGNYLANGNRLTGIVYASLLSEIGERVGSAIVGGTWSGNTVKNAAGEEIVQTFGQGVWSQMQGAGIGTVSSMFATQLAQSLGMDRFGGEVFTNVAATGTNAVIQQVVSNLTDSSVTTKAFDNIFNDKTLNPAMYAQALGAFIGAKLGAMVVNPETDAAVLLSSVGSAVGVIVALGTASSVLATAALAGETSILVSSGLAVAATATSSGYLTTLGNLVVPGIGAFLGFVLGAVIGNLFGSKKPKTPTASAETALQLPYAHYEVGAWTSANGGSLSLVQTMATDARQILNGLIQQITYGDDAALVANLDGALTTQVYGHTGSQIYVRINNETKDFDSADEAVEYGSLKAIHNTKVIGGDLFIKRVILGSGAQDLLSLVGDIQTASDFKFFGNNRELINGYIAEAFATLSPADKAFYVGSDKVIVDTILADGIAGLSATQEARYNAPAYKAQFDRILAAVDAQSVANPWIVTLLRASELGLDQFATSDFYGGLSGFLGSFGVGNVDSKVHYEDFNVNAATGGGMRIGLDKVVTTTDVYSAAAQIYRLYEGLLNRGTDYSGLTDYANQLELGQKTLVDIAASIIGSIEFQNLVGANLTDTGFIEGLYTTVQNRTATSGEIQSWLDSMAAGQSRAEVAVGFTESSEFINTSASGVQAGLTYTSHQYADFFEVLSQASDWGDSVTIDQISQVGMIASTGTTTNGSEFIDGSGNASGVTINDWREVWTGGTSHWESGGDNVFIGGAGNDTLVGGDGNDWLMGSGGYDIMWGAEGNDVLINPYGGGELHGEEGDDYIMGGWGSGDDGNDTMVGRTGYDTLSGGNGDDLFIIAKDYSNNWYLGGDWGWGSDPDGSDTLSAERIDVGVTFDLDYRPAYFDTSSDSGEANPDTRSVSVYARESGQWLSVINTISIENATGSLFGDLIYGTTGDNVLRGLAGNDTLYARAGDDVVEGGAGADTLYGGDGLKDVLSYESSAEGVFVDLSTGEVHGGDAEGDVFSEFESVRGSKFSDQLRGDSGTNVIEGLDGDDWIVATGGGISTTITIPDYNDWYGYGGLRQITYWTGADVYNGGSGNDTVDYSEATSGVTAYLGSYTIGDSANTATAGSGTGGLAQGHTYISIESIVGSGYNDSLSAGAGAQSFAGGAGNDAMAGGAGSDNYLFGRGDASDTVTESNTGNNTLVLGPNITVSDMYNPTSGGSSGYFDIGIRGTSDIIRFTSNFADLGNNRLKTISFNGQSSLDVSNITYQPSGATGYNDALDGWADQADLVQGFEGNDILTGSGTSSESKGNIFIGGTGNDTLKASVGDDQYAYDRGDGIDTITDTGGDDTLVFGSTVAADDVIYNVVGNDLYIGLKDATNAALTADQVSERIKVVNGGVQYQVVDGYNQTTVYSTTLNTIEYVLVGGTSIDLTKLNIDWTVQTTWQYGDTYPIVLDLGGDGLNLTAVEDSDIVVQTAQGGLSKLGWASAADAFLAVDRDGDGSINKLSEISFAQDKEGATSDLEGLKTWDTNGDGLLNASDTNFDKILVWQDLNQNGRSTTQELRTLTEAGIVAIDLNGTATGYTPGSVIDNYVQNTMSFIWADGSRGNAYDVALARHVLGTDGLYAGEYQAEWGARDEDGTLGRLLNDPETAAKAALVAQRRSAVEDIVATYDEISVKARVDFTDTDEVSAEVAERLAEMNSSERAAWLSGQASGVDDKIRLMSSAQTIAVQLDQAEQATDDLVSSGLSLAQTGLSTSQAGLGANDTAGIQGSTVTPSSGNETQSVGGGVTASEPLGANSGISLSAGASDNAWWRQDAQSVADGSMSLGALMASMYGTSVTAIGSGPGGGIVDDTLTRQQLLLLQSMAGFGGRSGGEAAVWQRSASPIQQPLAASSGVRGISQDAAAALVA
jgi:Ca2+-binding RTX toxin-like protein